MSDKKKVPVIKASNNSGSPKTNVSLNSIGQQGLWQYSGYIYEDFLLELQWPRATKTYKEMAANDPIIGGMLFAVKMLIKQVEWKLVPADDSAEAKEIADFVETCMNDMDSSWIDTIDSILSYLVYGYSVHEITYKKRLGPSYRNPRYHSKYSDGRLGWRNLDIRAQETIQHWFFDPENGNLKGVQQYIPNTAKFVEIPRKKFLLFRVQNVKGNPESVSVLRNAYRPWYYKKSIEDFESIGVERDLAGLPVIHIPAAYMSPDAGEDEQALYKQAQDLVTSIRQNSQAGVVMPLAYDEQGKDLFKLELLTSHGGAKMYDTEQIIQRYNANIAQTMLADFILLGMKSVGSYALSSSKTKLFGIAIGAWTQNILNVFNSDAIPQLLDVNNIDPALTPLMTASDVSFRDITEIADYIEKLSNAGAISPDENLENYLRETADLPTRKPEDKKVETAEERIKDKQIASSERIAEAANQKKPQEILNRESDIED